MKTRKTKLSDQERRASELRLQRLGILESPVADSSPPPERILVRQVDHDFAKLYELPSGEIGVVIPIQITVLTAGILIVEQELTTTLDDFPLDFTEPTEWRYYRDMIDECSSPRNLNGLLMDPLPLRPRKVSGVIVANGWSKVPPELHDNSSLKARLCLIDERGNEICSEFDLRLDRSLKRMYEERSKRRELARPAGGGRLYASLGGYSPEQKNVTRQEFIRPGEDGAGMQKRQKPN